MHTLANCGADRLYVLSERLKMQRHPVSCRLLISEKVEIVQEGAGGQGRAGEPGHECAAGGTELRAAEFAAVTGAPACLESILPQLLPDEAPVVLARASLCSSCCSACGCGRLPVTGDPLRHGHGDAERPYFTHSPLLLDKLHCDAATGLSAGTPSLLRDHLSAHCLVCSQASQGTAINPHVAQAASQPAAAPQTAQPAPHKQVAAPEPAAAADSEADASVPPPKAPGDVDGDLADRAVQPEDVQAPSPPQTRAKPSRKAGAKAAAHDHPKVSSRHYDTCIPAGRALLSGLLALSAADIAHK